MLLIELVAFFDLLVNNLISCKKLEEISFKLKFNENYNQNSKKKFIVGNFQIRKKISFFKSRFLAFFSNLEISKNDFFSFLEISKNEFFFVKNSINFSILKLQRAVFVNYFYQMELMT